MQVETTFCVERSIRDEDGEHFYNEYELIIRGDVDPYVPANFRGHPDNWTPPEGGSSCVEEVLIEVKGVEKRWTGKLTTEEEKEAEQALFDQFELNCEDNFDPPDSGYDDYMDRCDDEWMDYIN